MRKHGAPNGISSPTKPTRAPSLTLTIPPGLLAAYRAAEGPHALPPPSHLLARAMVDELAAHGVAAPPQPPPSPQTAAATAARMQRRRERHAAR